LEERVLSIIEVDHSNDLDAGNHVGHVWDEVDCWLRVLGNIVETIHREEDGTKKVKESYFRHTKITMQSLILMHSGTKKRKGIETPIGLAMKSVPRTAQAMRASIWAICPSVTPRFPTWVSTTPMLCSRS
jgi:hypothetical protein